MSLRTNMKHNMLYVILFVLLGLHSNFAEPVDTDIQDKDTRICDPKCGCDGVYIYDEQKDECVLNMHKLMKTVLVRYDNQNDDEILSENGMARSIYIEGQKLFQGIMISVVLFITCASLCVLSACIYCCRINYTDQKLKKDMQALAKQMNKDGKSEKKPLKPRITEPKSESCNVVVEQAGVFVV